ncbi:MAG: hypothetical protein U0271_15930 [Polyangiaceae bacterium]
MGSRVDRKITGSRVTLALAMLVVGCGGAGRTTSNAEGDGASSSSAASSTSSSPSASSSSASAKSSAEAPLAEGEVRIAKHFPAVGDRASTSRERSTSLKGELRSENSTKPLDLTSIEPHNVEEECLAVEDKRCVKMRVSYGKVAKLMTVDGKAQAELAPIAGKTYVVERLPDRVRVSSPDGAEVTKAERERVAAEYGGPSQLREILEALPDRVKVGDKLDKLAKVLAEGRTLDSDVDMNIDVTIKVANIKRTAERTTVVLAVTMVVRAPEGKDDGSTMDLAGEIELRTDGGQPVRSEMSGAITVKFGGRGHAAGTFSDKSTMDYSW